MEKGKPIVGVVMGSESDRETMKPVAEVLEEFGVPYEWKVISAHRTPEYLHEYVNSAEENGVHIFIAGAGGAAHLPGVMASFTTLPVIGVPVHSQSLNGMDSLLSIVQMPKGIPVATMAIGKSGARNAALFALSILALKFPEIRTMLRDYREKNKNDLIEQSKKTEVVFSG